LKTFIAFTILWPYLPADLVGHRVHCNAQGPFPKVTVAVTQSARAGSEMMISNTAIIAKVQTIRFMLLSFLNF
jgi:hypothetical protein